MLCEECLHMVFEDNRCRCTEGKVIGCMYIGMAKGCIYYNISTNKRCKNRVIETGYGKMYMCIEHNSKKKVHIKLTESKKTDSNKKTTDESKKSETELKKLEKPTKRKKKEVEKKEKKEKKEVEKKEKKEVKPKRKIVKNIKD